MIRSKIDEIKFLRSVAFKRPTTSDFLANCKIVRRKAPCKIMKLGCINESSALNESQSINKSPHTVKHLNQFTPETSKSQISTPIFANKRSHHETKANETEPDSFPYKTQEFLELYKAFLSKHEAAEVLDYQYIYYWGKNTENCRRSLNLFRFDDDRGNYLCDKNDHIAYRFQVIRNLGKGTYGQVYESYDHKENTSVAIKIIKNTKRFNSQAHTEIKILKLLTENDKNDANSIMKLKECFLFRNHICIVTELLDMNLYEALKSNNFSSLPLVVVKNIAIQILMALKYLKKMKVIHCDVKPENILFIGPGHSTVKLIDFGSSCQVSEKLFTYIQSRFYRAPEIILGLPYDCSIDMWSFGCVLAEIVVGRPLFLADTEQELLYKIVMRKGPVPEHLLSYAVKKQKFFGDPETMKHEAERDKNEKFVPLVELVGNDLALADLIDKCLDWDPYKRITPEAALSHPWLKNNILAPVDVQFRFQKSYKKKNLIINCL